MEYQFVVDNLNLFVVDLGILYTRFVYPTGQVFYYSNTVLANKHIYNIGRSGDQTLKISFKVSGKLELDSLIIKFNNFVENSPSFKKLDYLIESVDNSAFLVIEFVVKFKGNFQKGFKRGKRFTLLVEKFTELVKEQEITFTPLPIKLKIENSF